MAIKFTSQQDGKIPAPLDGSTAITINTLLFADVANGVVKSATSAAGKTVDLYGIARETVISGATLVDVVPLHDRQRVQVDCNANTASNQLFKRHAMTDAATINNTSSDVATTLGVFFAEEIKGAASDKKLEGYFLNPGQVTA